MTFLISSSVPFISPQSLRRVSRNRAQCALNKDVALILIDEHFVYSAGHVQQACTCVVT